MWWLGKRWGGGGGVGGGAFGLCLLLFYSCLLTNVPEVTAPLTIHCVQFGQSWTDDSTFTIGGERLSPRHREAMQSLWDDPLISFNDPSLNGPCPKGYNFFDYSKSGYDGLYYSVYWDMCPKGVEIRPYLVKQNGRVLNGWLQVEVEYTGSEGGMEFVYIQIRDEVMNAIGEFVIDPNEQCTTDRRDLIKPSKYQYLPCSAIGQREAKASQGIFVARSTQYKDYNPDALPFLPNEDLRKGIQFTWRLNEFWCNRHQRIRIDAEVWVTGRANLFDQFYVKKGSYHQNNCRHNSEHKDCRVLRKASDWIYPKWFGAADIKLPGSLTCDTLAMKDKGDGLGMRITPEALADSWFYKSKQLVYEEDYLSNGKTYSPYSGQIHVHQCQVPPRNGRGSTTVTFGGRCKEHFTKDVSHNYLPKCVTNVHSSTPGFEKEAVDYSNFVKYTEYRHNVVATRKEICEQECIYPTAADVPDIQKFKSDIANLTLRKAPVSFKTVTSTRLQDRFETSWQTRKYHGNLFIFVTMFLIPVSIFFVRYFKETCMNQMSGGCAYWYWFHLLMSCIVPTLYYSGHAAMHTNLDNFGYSKSPHGELHVLVGRIFIWLYMAMVALGAIRPAPRRALLVCNTLHSIIGFLLYFMCIFLVINSTFIPASPTVHECDEVTGLPIGYSFTAWMVTGWFGFDMLCHILLTVAQVVIDRQEKIKRSGFGLPFMPMMPGDHPHDLVGHRFRKLIFGIYVIVSVIFTIILITVLFNRDEYPEYCVMGEMTCNLSEYRPHLNSSPFGCAKTSLEYYNKVYEKYEINLTQVLSSAAG